MDPTVRSTADEIAALRRGDRLVTEEVLRALHDDVRLRLHRLLGPRADLDDAVQDALIEIAAALPSFEGRSTLRTFAARITVRVAYRYFGRPHHEPLELAAVASGDDPEDRVARRQTLRRMARCLEKLSEKRRVAFVLCCVEGFSPREAAEIEGVSSLVMRTRLFQARGELERLMKGDPFFDSMGERSEP